MTNDVLTTKTEQNWH